MKKILKSFIIVFIISMFIPLSAFAQTDYSFLNDELTPSKISTYSSYDYVINKYDIDIVVNENNTFDITEKITAYFNVDKHGIYRTIPLKNKVVRLDGTTSKNRAEVANLSIDNEYQISKFSLSKKKIKIGSQNKTLRGSQDYTIKYTYNIGKDPIKGYDELYYNLIGTEWDTVIGNITFNITMPKNFDTSKLGFSSGKYGSTDSSKITYIVNGNTITGSYNGILDKNEGLTIRCKLDEGYFASASDIPINPIIYLVFFIPTVFLLICICIWYKYGKDEPIIETIEFYPPEGFNSSEIGFLYNGKSNNKDITSLLIYLANKGYIKIAELDEINPHTKKKDFKITKLKEYDGNNYNEQAFLKGLFKYGLSDNEVKISELYNKFYSTMNTIRYDIQKKENKRMIFEMSSLNKKIFLIIMIIISYMIISIPVVSEFSIDADIWILLIFFSLYPAIGLTFLIYGLFEKSKVIKLFDILFGSIWFLMIFLPVILPTLMNDSISLISYIYGTLCTIGMTICLIFLPKRNKYGNYILGKIKGFKHFLETAEKENLEALANENPTYFYDILPYTYVLDVSDKWIKKFESISLQAPDWYDGTSSFDISSFESFVNSAMSSAQSSMSSDPTSDSGGGSSGGGSGGGGGGSW